MALLLFFFDVVVVAAAAAVGVGVAVVVVLATSTQGTCSYTADTNKPCCYGTQCCSCTQVTVYATRYAISHAEGLYL
jgi:hypothetical protein